MKLQIKIALLFSLLTASFIALLSLLVYYFASRNSFEDFYHRLEIRAIIAAKATFEQDMSDKRTYENIRQRHLHTLPVEEEHFLKVNGNQVERKPSLKLPETFYQEALQSEYATYRLKKRFYAGHLYTGQQGRYLVVVSAENEYSTAYLLSLKKIFIIAFFISVIIAFTVGMLFSKQILKPIRSVTSRVKDISSTNLHLRLEMPNKTDEIGVLAGTFNNMLDRLETSFESQKNFISNASHELSTPLTAVIGEAEYALRKERDNAAYKDSIQVILDEAYRLKNITTSLLHLAQTGFDGKKLSWEKLRVDELLYAVFETVRNIHPECRISVDHSLFPEDESLLTIEGNEPLLHMALSNIIMNGCKYSDNQPVGIALGASNNEVLITINDQGIGIPADELKYIYDPFFRASNTRSYKGYGIGLPLARNIIRLHNGSLHVTAQQGKGTQVQIRLPITLPQS